jgi:hypothetical protein
VPGLKLKMLGLGRRRPEDGMGFKIGRAIERRACVLAMAMTTEAAGFTAEPIALARHSCTIYDMIAYAVDPGKTPRAGRTRVWLAYQGDGRHRSSLSRPQPGMLRAALSRPDGEPLANAAIVLAVPTVSGPSFELRGVLDC